MAPLRPSIRERPDSRKEYDIASEAVRVWLLGGFRISVGSREIGEREWPLRKAASLAKLLALSPGHRLHREVVMDRLWPDLGSRAAANNLRGTIHVLRRVLAPHLAKSSEYVSLRDEEIILCPNGQLWVDVDAFEEAAKTARLSREPAACRAAAELYAGELLPEDRYEDWAEERRRELRATYLELLLELAGLYEERGEYRRAIYVLKNMLAEEPAREAAHAGLMRLYALAGCSSEALRQYGLFEEVLRRELGAEPDMHVRRLREEILAGRFPPDHLEDRRPEDVSDTGPHNLPVQRSSFVGREHDIGGIKRLLSMTGLLTHTGAGGSGKTRLSLEVARDLVGLYPDGVWLVELAPLSEEALVPQAVAATLGVSEQPGRPLTETMVSTIREKKLLLVLDNCEHLIDAARLADTLLDSCPGLRILATSREPLGVTGEVTWKVLPLSVPDAERLLAAEDLMRYESVRLFEERARLKLPGFGITKDNAPSVAEVCRKLDGIPLAIELATAHVTVLAVEQIAERLGNSLKLLAGGRRTAAPRQRTMRATLEWSHELLDEAEKRLFRRLSVFAGGWTLEAAEAVGEDGIEKGDVLYLLSRLVDKSLVAAEARVEGALRYRMLEPVRQYGSECLEASGEAQQTRESHAGYYLTFVERAEPELSGPDQALWLDRLEREHDNLRAILRWSIDGEGAELGLRLAGRLWLFWYTRGYLSEGREWLEKAAASTGGARALHLKARALRGAGYMVARQGDLEAAKELLGEALALFRELEDTEGIASALALLGIVTVLGQELAAVPALYEEAMNLKPEVQDPRTLAYLLQFSAIMAVGQGDWEQADAVHEESLEYFREVRDIAGINASLTNLGLSALAQAEYPKASALLEENLRVVAGSDKSSIMYNLLGLACAASAQGQPVHAARLWGAAEAISEAFDLQIMPLARSRINHDEHLSNARSQLGETAFETVWAEGKAMTLEEAVEYALEVAGPDAPDTSIPEGELSHALSRREQEVATLVAQELTNRQIAQELSVSERTVETHVRNVFKKLGLKSRFQLAERFPGVERN